MKDAETTTALDEYRALASSLDAPARIPVEVRTTVEDPYDAYRRVRNATGGVYLETTGGRDGWGYFTVEPERWLTTTASDESPDSFTVLEALLDEERLVRGECDVPYPCGAFGWLSYDVARELEALPATTDDDRGLPRLRFGVYDRVAAWREPQGDGPTTLRITCCPTVRPGDDFDAAYRDALGQARGLAERVHRGEFRPETPPVEDEVAMSGNERAVTSGSDGTTMSGNEGAATFRNEVGREEYERRVERVKEYIRDGDTFQANISQRLVADATVHPVEVFRALRRVNPAPYSGLLEFPDATLVSTSPELLLDCAGDRLVTEPIAGTRPRGETPEADGALEAELLDSEKEHAEHAMLVDLQRNDLGKVCEYGSVEVTDYRRIDRYSEVMHTVSVVEGTRRDDASVADAIAAVFPGGTITGAPKPRTMEIIDEVEATRRGPYTGSIGVLGFDERATLNMTIRTLVEHRNRYYLRVGAGIVHDSDPATEYDETLDKGRALINAVDEALGLDADLALSVREGIDDARR